MNIPSRPILVKLKELVLVLVLGDRLITQDTGEFRLTLKYLHGIIHSVRAVGIECITEVKRVPSVKHLRGMFPDATPIYKRVILSNKY